MGGGRLAGLPHPAGCIFFYAIILAYNLLVVNGNGGKDFCETRKNSFMFSPPVENNGSDVQLEHQ